MLEIPKKFIKNEMEFERLDYQQNEWSDWLLDFAYYEDDYFDWPGYTQVNQILADEWAEGNYCVCDNEKCLILDDKFTCSDSRYSDRIVLSSVGIRQIRLLDMSQI